MKENTRLEKCLSEHKGKILSPYLTAGFPEIDLTVPLLHKMVEAGADIIELGIPFSDPMAEGLVIQNAMEKALQNGMTLSHIFKMVREFRLKDTKTPIILMGYLNSIEIRGYEAFANEAAQTGVDGTIIVDLPPEESDNIHAVWKKHGLDMIYLCSQTTTENRLKMIASKSGAYVYYVSLKGVTGSTNIDVAQIKEQYHKKKSLLNRPLLVGFGIKNKDTAKAVASISDGIVIGAAFLEAINKQSREECLESAYHFLHDIRLAIN